MFLGLIYIVVTMNHNNFALVTAAVEIQEKRLRHNIAYLELNQNHLFLMIAFVPQREINYTNIAALVWVVSVTTDGKSVSLYSKANVFLMSLIPSFDRAMGSVFFCHL